MATATALEPSEMKPPGVLVNLFPIRSSPGWFLNPNTVEQLERHIKVALLCYDELRFQDGSYLLHVTEKGAAEIPLPKGRQRELKFGGDLTISIAKSAEGPHLPLLQGPPVLSYHVDFLPVLERNDLLGVDGVEMWDFDLKEEVVAEVQPLIQRSQQDKELNGALTAPSFERNYILKAMHLDAVLAGASGVSVTFDQRVTQAIRLTQRRAGGFLKPDVGPVAFNRALEFKLPDVRDMTWDEVIEIRESLDGIDFRDMIRKVRSRAESELLSISTEADWREFVSTIMMEDTLMMVPRKTSGLVSLAASFVFNALGFGAVSTLGTVAETFSRRPSWINLLERP